MNKNEKLALQIAAKKIAQNEVEAAYNKLKTQLLELVGDDGASYDNDLAKVSVTKRTVSRLTGKVAYSLDPDKFLELDPHVRANLIKQGVITEKKVTISGQAPSVRVSLKK